MGTAEQQEAVQGIMPKLTSARTLREIADLIAGSAGTTSAVAPPTAAPVAPAVSTAPGRDVITELRAVAAERTGYPPEMLDLDAGIESDLGIDSIKRVEILTALQKLGSPEQQESVQAIMNKLTSARTLREIAELIASCAGAGAPVQAAATVAAPAVASGAPAGRDFVSELRAVAAERT